MSFIGTSKANEGSVTVEAAVAMPAFIIVILVMIFFMRLIFIFGTMQHAINETAGILSNYGYLYAKTLQGVNEKTENYLSSESEGFKEHLKTIADGIDSFSDIASIKDAVSEISSNPKGELKSVISLIAEGAFRETKTKISASVIRFIIEGNLKTDNLSADQRMKRFNIEQGINGLDISESNILSDGKNIEIVVRYKMKSVFLLPEIYIIQRSYAKACLGGENGSDIAGSQDSAANVWNLKPMERGIEIQRREGRNLPKFFPVIAIYKDGKVISIKSIDLESTTYAKPENIRAQIEEYIDDLANFKDGTYLNKKIVIKSKELVLVVPQGSINDSNKGVIEECKKYASNANIKLVIKDCYGKKSVT